MKQKFPRLLVFSLCLGLATLVLADEEHCVSIGSAGVGTTTPGPQYHNVGQMTIGVSTDGVTRAFHGCMWCLRVGSTCKLGDVNGDGVVNGLDIQPFTDVKVSGTGTPFELCAADLDLAAFIALLLAP